MKPVKHIVAGMGLLQADEVGWHVGPCSLD